MLPKPYYRTENGVLYHGDCLDILPHLEPVDLVLTDPPYGIGADKNAYKNSGRVVGYGNRRVAKKIYADTNWDIKISNEDLIKIINKSKYSVVFGGNYYYLPAQSCWVVWDKKNYSSKFADCEIAWTNYGGSIRLVKHLWNGFAREGNEKRYNHPTQKPVQVFLFIINLCPIKAETICDPFFGSGTTGVACERLGRKWIGIEIEEKYCEIAAKRIEQENKQLKIPGC